MYICSEVMSTTVIMRNTVQISGLLHVNFSPSVCLALRVFITIRGPSVK